MAEFLEASSLIDRFVLTLRSSKQSLGFAESCTGGLLSSLLTRMAGVSDVYKGSVISYANEAKKDLLHVQESTLIKFGAVSEKTAIEMALGAKEVLKVDWSVAVTGVAGPTGGSVEKPVGTVCFAVVGPRFEYAETMLFAGDRTRIQDSAAVHAFKILNKALNSNY